MASLLCLLTGVLDLVSALTVAERGRLHALRMLVPGGVTTASNALTLVTGVLLVLLARGLRRRKRRAWRVVVALLLGSIALHLLKGLDVEEAAVALGLLVGSSRCGRNSMPRVTRARGGEPLGWVYSCS